ncbi:DUF3509 domain-containing protein [Pseudomonas peli]|uniref:DUF3509 domain-containing protein n=1 Tax=Pseudomonas peli TaxID=592361 RepID=UPI003D31D548
MKFINEIYNAFPGHTVTLTPRPDGNVLLTLCMGSVFTLRKVFPGEAVSSETGVHAIINELTRDLKLASGEVTWQGKDSPWIRRDLPTFTGEPIQLTAAKTLFSRREIKNY